MRHRRTLLYSALALAVLATGAAYLALREPPHRASFEPPSKFPEGNYYRMSLEELSKLKDAGDWRAFLHSSERFSADFDEPFVKARADAGYEAARVKLADHYFDLEQGRQPLSEVFENLDWRYAPKDSVSQPWAALRERMGPGRAEGIALLETAADGGYPAAQCLLGQRLLRGDQVPKNIPRGLHWLERAARGGDTTAAALLTRLYYQGKLAPRDDAKCLFFARLTKNPYIPTALLLLNGRGDRAELPGLVRALAANTDAYLFSADPLLEARLLLRTKSAGLAPEWASHELTDYDAGLLTSIYDRIFHGQSAAWFEEELPEYVEGPESAPAFMGADNPQRMPGTCVRHAQAGDALAQYVLGCSRLLQTASAAERDAEAPRDENAPYGKFRAKSPATPEDKAEGVAWLRQSAAQGLHAGMGKLGECLLNGTGVKTDRVEAAYWLALATTDIHTHYAKLRDKALAELAPDERAAVAARVLESRRATLAQVRPELEAKARAGDNEARFALARLITRVTPDNRPDAEALALLDAAAQANHRYSLRLLGLHHLTAPGGDIPRALALLDRAARSGDFQSAGILARVYYQGKLVPRDDAKCLEYTGLTQSSDLLAALAINGRCEQAPAVREAIEEIKDGIGSGVLRERIRLRLNAPRTGESWFYQEPYANLRTADYDAVCSGNAITWFDQAPESYLNNSLLNYENVIAPQYQGACVRDAQAGDKLAQYVLGSDRMVTSFEFAEGDPAVETLRAEALDWLKRSADQGFRPAMEKLAYFHDPDHGLKPDKVESAFWKSLHELLQTGAKPPGRLPPHNLTPDERDAVSKRLDAFRLAHPDLTAPKP